MNVTELARRLKISTSELRLLLPKLGFDIGQKAIKIDEKIAQEIIKNWRRLLYEYNKKEEYNRRKATFSNKCEEDGEVKKDVFLPSIITVREFSVVLSLPVNVVIAELMKNGIMASLNERLDYDTAAIIAVDLGFNVEREVQRDEIIEIADKRLKQVMEEQRSTGTVRPPVIVIMGHVDHGKTKLLDTIRKTNVMATEAGGITQHIGAYQMEHSGRILTFIDTPGHEAFTAMRSRGAKVADIAILVVAADDSVKPQTVEALRIIQSAQIPMIVAINKIDKEEANIDKVKNDLAQYNIISEDWGGKTAFVPISALAGTGVPELLDTIVFTADVNSEQLVADPDRLAAGTVIESHVHKGEGIVATILVQAGTLKVGDILSINGNYYGKIRSMRDHNGGEVTVALPAKPVKIIGLKIQPKVGDFLEVPNSEKELSKKVKKYELERNKTSSILLRKSEEDVESGKLSLLIVLRADTLGSLEAIMESLDKIHSDYIQTKVIAKGLGSITENDILMAKSSEALLISFHTVNTPSSELMAREQQVPILKYDIIYKLIEDIKERMESKIGEEIVRKDLGKLEVLGIFKTEKKAMILGGKVVSGVISLDLQKKIITKIIVTRASEYVTEGILEELQSGKQIVKSVVSGNECGLRFIGRPDILVGDILEFYTEEKKKRVL